MRAMVLRKDFLGASSKIAHGMHTPWAMVEGLKLQA